MTTTTELSYVIEASRRAPELRTLLRLNAAFSAATGAAATFATAPIARALDVGPDWVVRGVGIGLLVYAVDLVVIANQRPTRVLKFGRAAAAADAAWALGTVGLVATGVISGTGAVLLVVLGFMVATFAVTQWRAVVTA